VEHQKKLSAKAKLPVFYLRLCSTLYALLNYLKLKLISLY
jgi:hypothetical protein